MTRIARLLPLLGTLALLSMPQPVQAQDLGFVNSIFGRVHRISLFVQSLEPRKAPILDRSGRGCITMSLCGAGVKVMIDLDTRSNWMNLELGLGAGYLRALQGSSSDSLDIRGALRSLPVVNVQASILMTKWITPYVNGSFGLVDIWNGRAHNAEGMQAELKASTFEYGVSGGLAIRPDMTNGRILLEAGYRARTFASVGYGFTEPLGTAWPRQLDLSGWQVMAGWQFDLRPIAKSPDFSGSYVLTRVDGSALPLTLSQFRGDSVNVREELMQAWLDIERNPRRYRVILVTRRTWLNADGIPQEIRYAEPMEERGTWLPDRSGIVTFTPESPREAEVHTGTRIEDELVVIHPATGRRLHFRRVRST